MIANVVPIKRPSKIYPSYWPESDFHKVVHRLYQNQPLEKHPEETFFFGLKVDACQPVVTIIVTQDGNALFQGGTSQSEETAVQEWFTKRRASIYRLAESGFRGRIVGQLDDAELPERLLMYYVIQGRVVYLDSPSIDKLAGIRAGITQDAFVTVPLDKTISVHVDKRGESVMTRALHGASEVNEEPIVGFPIISFEPRTSEDGSEGAPPRLLSSDIHMSYMAFAGE